MNSIESLRKVPSSIEAEKALLGGILLKPDAISDVIEIIKPDFFYRNTHKVIYQAMLDLYANNETIEIILLMETLKKNNKFDEIGGEKVLFEIIEDIPNAINLLSYANIIKEKSILRKLGEVGTKIVEMTHEGYDDVDSILDKAESLIFKISESKESKDILNIKDIMVEEFERLQKVYENKGISTGISSGFKNYDLLTNGFHPSDLIILAARPAMGKTAFALNLALNAAIKSDKSVLIFSLEMGTSQLFQRLLAIESGVALQKIRTGFLQDDEWGRIGLATSTLGEAKISIADTPSVNILEIRAIARRLKAANKLDMMVIDYLQLINGNARSDGNRQQEISEISRSLKGMARELDIPIIALSQLSRATEGRADRRPILSDLRESGAIEQDADIVLFLYRDDYYDDESPLKGITEVIIGKQRNGPTGTAQLTFFHELTKFRDYTSKVE
ncbi:MAG: replicative DNA helicase [Fusobacteriaceae bacterium]|nr:replicative DNA helicase [Fusobacteriaceae bacterium]